LGGIGFRARACFGGMSAERCWGSAPGPGIYRFGQRQGGLLAVGDLGDEEGGTPEEAAFAVWRRLGARVASQRCPILRGGKREGSRLGGVGKGSWRFAVGGKAINPAAQPRRAQYTLTQR
jgi:hypothetical protein